MKALNLPIAAAALVLLAAGLQSTPASAADQKVNHAMACVPLSPNTNFSDLYYRPSGVKNIRATSEIVVCPIEVDADSVNFWTATDGKTASIDVTFHALKAGTATCEVSVGSSLDGTKATFSGTQTLTAGEVDNVSIYSVHGDAVSQGFMVNYPVALYCTMPAESSILRIRVIENNIDTDASTL